MTWLHRLQVIKCCLVSGLITEISWTSPLLKEKVTGVVTGVLGQGISDCVSDIWRDFLKYYTLSNKCSIQDLLIISCWTRLHSHILTTTWEAWFCWELQCTPLDSNCHKYCFILNTIHLVLSTGLLAQTNGAMGRSILKICSYHLATQSNEFEYWATHILSTGLCLPSILCSVITTLKQYPSGIFTLLWLVLKQHLTKWIDV